MLQLVWQQLQCEWRTKILIGICGDVKW